MSNLPKHDLKKITKLFQIEGFFNKAAPYGNGHINDTYQVAFEKNGGFNRYIYQRVNHNVFPQPEKVMENIEKVTRHIAKKLHKEGVSDLDKRVLTLIPTVDGKTFAYDEEGNLWRVYDFIEDMVTFDIPETPSQVFEVGSSFGEFQKHLMDLSPTKLHETIPFFHHTRSRYQTFLDALDADPCNRAESIHEEISFATTRELLVDVLIDLEEQGVIPTRVIHNDTKMNNLLLDGVTERGMCVTDLDTTMPGLILYDFGDMVRTATGTAAEDEQDLRKVSIRMDLFRALVDGYLTAVGPALNLVERKYLVSSGKVITFEVGLRFLTDYLLGDVYFKINRSGHNLDRARTQFKLVESIERLEEEMEQYVENWQATLPYPPA